LGRLGPPCAAGICGDSQILQTAQGRGEPAQFRGCVFDRSDVGKSSSGGGCGVGGVGHEVLSIPLLKRSWRRY
jgi:hypothetical protein